MHKKFRNGRIELVCICFKKLFLRHLNVADAVPIGTASATLR